MKHSARILLFVVPALPLLSGRVVCPHPPELMNGTPIPQRAVEPLQTGVSTRQDVLLLLGRPNRVEMAEHYYFYLWNISTIIAAFGMPPAVIGDNVATDRCFICLEFAEDGLVRWERFKRGMFDPPDETILKTWMANPPPATRQIVLEAG